MLKLLAVSDLNTRGVTVNRLASVERLAENGHDIASRVRNKYPGHWDIDWCDCVLFLRAMTLDDVTFLKECRFRGKKIWLDTDDDLLNVPFDHSGFHSFQEPELRAAYQELHKRADHVTFSTAELAGRGLADNWSIIPCSYPDELINRLTQPKTPTKTVIWRGTNTHERSLDQFGPAIVEVMNRHPDWRIEFFGHRPWKILEQIKSRNWLWYGFTDVTEMVDRIHGTQASVHIVPRTNDLFTRARSSVSYVEATLAGATTVAPDWPEWQLPGILTYSNDFVDRFEQAILDFDTDAQRNRRQQSVEYVRANRTWSATNRQHAEVLNKIMGVTP